MKNLLIFVISILLSNSLKADTITITADEWCPYNCSDTILDKAGFLVDIISWCFNQEGHSVEYIISKSYVKAIKNVRTNKFNALIGPTHNEVPDFIFPEIPLAYSYDVLIVPSDLKWEYTNEDSLAELRLGVVRGYEYDDFIENHIAKYKDDIEKNMVLLNRIFFHLNL